jgi:hypothetical protein
MSIHPSTIIHSSTIIIHSSTSNHFKKIRSQGEEASLSQKAGA